MKLSAVLIVKNESSCLDRCLQTLRGFDEIIVCDTGSEDNTIEIAKKYTDKVYDDYKWNDSFCEARNHALSKVTGDWVLSIDADEELLDSVDEIKKVIDGAEKKGVKTVNVTQVSGTQSNVFPRLFKRCPEVYWCGAIHNYLSIPAQADSDIKIRYHYSEAHKKDPDRALRILKKEVEKGGKSRELYYLAREYWYRKDYITAIYWLDEYLAVSKFLAEKADGYLMAARCYWALKKGDTARQYCLMALNINANFKEALGLMAEMSWEHNAKTWREFEKIATNENVLFVRNIKPNPSEPIEVCFVTYQRPQRIPEILKQLKAQTIQDFKVNIWNNSKEKLDISDFPQNRIKVIDSEENIGSQARFRLAKQTTGNPIIFFDDDEDLSANFVEYNYEQYLKFGKKCILGWFTRTFDKESYWKCLYADYGMEVDYIGAGGMILDREIFDKEPLLQNIPEPFDQAEDLYLCYLARMKHKTKLIKINPACSILVDEKDQYKKIDKENIFKELRKMGWRLVKEMAIREEALKNLIDVKKALDDLKVPFYLMDGTLLGIYRDGDFIVGDEDDIDIGIDEKYSDRTSEIIETLSQKGLQNIKSWEFKGKIEGMAFKRNGNHVDIFLIHRKGKDAYNLARNQFSENKKEYMTYVYPAYCFEKSEKINFEGIEFDIPYKVEDFLEARYKNWQTPKRRPEFNWLDLEMNPAIKLDYEI